MSAAVETVAATSRQRRAKARSITVDAATLAALGDGDARAGEKRLRLAIADLRRRVPIVGPTAKPETVRFATIADEPALEDLLALDVAENAAGVAPLSSAAIRAAIKTATRIKGRALLGLIEYAGAPVGVVGLAAMHWWWSDRQFLEQKFIFVHPAHRQSRHAADLIRFSHWAADQLTAALGYPVYVIEGVTALIRTDAKVRLMAQHSNWCGAQFVYPHPGKAAQHG